MFFEFLESRDNSPETIKGLGFLDNLLRSEVHPSAESVHDAARGQRVDELRTTRAHGRLPNAKLESTDASTCSQAQFTAWLYFIRNTPDYVTIDSAESEAA